MSETITESLTLTNPRTTAEIADWPNGRRGRVTAIFTVYQGTRGAQKNQERVERITTGKPKPTTYYAKIRIVDGSDGKTYLAALTEHGQPLLIPGTLKTNRYLYDNERYDEETRSLCRQVLELLND